MLIRAVVLSYKVVLAVSVQYFLCGCKETEYPVLNGFWFCYEIINRWQQGTNVSEILIKPKRPVEIQPNWRFFQKIEDITLVFNKIGRKGG